LKPPAAAKSHAAAKQPEPALAQRAVDPRQAAALETMAQAQQLWNSGSREAALELMRKAVAVAERSNASGAEPGGSPAFMGLVRELARMELAEGQVNQVWDLMVRLEPVISDQADLWAVRGNAAQRLGRHQDSVNAYLTALKLRPSEPRWMLGAAVSLAVQGQTGAAAELADKARAAGVVNSEVLAYLRQLGVPLRDR
jgi:MSHA biogenesis protein MshN